MVITLTKLDRGGHSKGAGSENALTNRTFVIADDSAKHRAIIRSILESLGLRFVGEAANGLECLSVVKRTHPDLVCLDVLMPVMHGIEVLGYLREDGFKGSIILVTQLSSNEALSEIRSRGFQPDAIFSKSDGREIYSTVLPDILMYEDSRETESQNIENPENVA